MLPCVLEKTPSTSKLLYVQDVLSIDKIGEDFLDIQHSQDILLVLVWTAVLPGVLGKTSWTSRLMYVQEVLYIVIKR